MTTLPEKLAPLTVTLDGRPHILERVPIEDLPDWLKAHNLQPAGTATVACPEGRGNSPGEQPNWWPPVLICESITPERTVHAAKD